MMQATQTNYVDTTETNHISLCAGYGGLDLGLRRVIPNLRTVAYVEIEAFACANLVAKMEAGHLDAAPIWTDLKTFDGDPFRGKVHILSGGYPCQPFSQAGKRKGKDDPRHLWPFIRRTIDTTQPLWCFFENVEGHLSMGYDSVYRDLRDMGYRVEAGLYSAAECGAPMEGARLFILATSDGERQQQPLWDIEESRRRTEYGGETVGVWPMPPGPRQYEWEPPRTAPKSEMGRDADGLACGLDYARLSRTSESRIDEIRLLGNGVVPIQAAKAFLDLIARF